jgi:hypothetical protein
MRFGKAKIAADGADLPHPNIGDVLLELGECREFFLQCGRRFQLAMSAQRADANRPVIDRDLAQLLEPFDIDQSLIANQSLFHCQ